jgi:hypothetical protein
VRRRIFSRLAVARRPRQARLHLSCRARTRVFPDAVVRLSADHPRLGRCPGARRSLSQRPPGSTSRATFGTNCRNCSGSAHHLNCTFGCILLRIKFRMHPVNYTLHVSPPTVVTASVSSELIRPSDRRGWPPCSEQTKQSEHLFALFGVHGRTNRTERLGDVQFCWRYGSMINKELAVNSLNLMERGPNFCTAEERVARPNARSETVGSQSNFICRAFHVAAGSRANTR